MQTTDFHFFYETKRLILRPVKIEDAEFYFHLMNSPKWLQFIGDRELRNLKETELYIQQKMLLDWKKNGYGSFTVLLQEDLTMIGTCGLFVREGLNGVDLGFALLSEYEGQGYAYEAASRIKDAAFNEFHLQELFAITLPENKVSQKLLKKLGFQSVGTTTLPGDEQEVLLLKAYPTGLPST